MSDKMSQPASASEATPSCSRIYQNYLEEMELKIRYMKNDIEFKKAQLKVDKPVPEKVGQAPFSQVKSYVPKSSLKHSYTNFVSANTSLYGQKQSPYLFTGTYPRQDAAQRTPEASIVSTVSNVRTIPNATSQPSYCHPSNFNYHAMPYKIPDGYVHSASNPNRIVLGNVNKKAAQSAHSLFGPKDTREVIKPIGHTVVKRTSIRTSDPIACQPFVKESSTREHDTEVWKIGTTCVPNNATILLSLNSLSPSLRKVATSTTNQTNPNPIYLSPDKRKVIYAGKTVGENGARRVLNLDNLSACLKPNRSETLISNINPSSSTDNHISFTTPAVHRCSVSNAVEPMSAVSFSEKAKGPRIPGTLNKTQPLTVQTAFKLISKYKLKKSPNKLLKSSRMYYYKRTTAPNKSFSSLAQGFPNTEYIESKNVFKLDKRNSKQMPTQNSSTAMSGPRSHVILSKHKLDKRPVLPHGNTVLYKQEQNVMKSLLVGKYSASLSKSHLKSRNISLIRSASKKTGIKSIWQPGGLISPGKPFSRRNLGNGQAVSRYRWRRRSGSSNEKIAVVQSRFKWSRPQVQSENVLKAQLKHRLRLLLRSKIQASKRLNSIRVNGTKKNFPGHQSSREKANLVLIGGILYRTSSRKLTRASPSGHGSSGKIVSNNPFVPRKGPASGTFVVKHMSRMKMHKISVRGLSFHIDASGTKLYRADADHGASRKQPAASTSVSRVDIGGVTYVQTKPGTLEQLSDGNKKRASQAVQRSLAIATAKFKRDYQQQKLKKHCMFFSRFGKCKRGESCPFIHDPKKVAVCTRFLRGKCDGDKCPFSHEASVHKMPVCLYYLRGACNKEKCPYLHVNVNPAAPVCSDFKQGYCSLGDKCKKLHSFVCPTFAAQGNCPRGEKCSMLHRSSRKPIAASARFVDIFQRKLLVLQEERANLLVWQTFFKQNLFIPQECRLFLA